MARCAISSRGMIDSYFFENVNVTEKTYKNMLCYFFFPKFLENSQDMIFQQDGAPPHFNIPVHQHLNEKLGKRWICRGGPVPWPPRSSDLTASDFFLWRYMKDRVFRTPPLTISVLRTRFTAAIFLITEKTLKKVVENTELRNGLLLRQNEARFVSLFNCLKLTSIVFIMSHR